MDDVYVVEAAATGDGGCPVDRIAEIAVCRVSGSEFETIYSETVALDPLDLGKDPLDRLSSGFGIGVEDLYSGIPADRVVADVQGILFGRSCTAYDVGNVFGRYLSFEPWDATGNVSLLPSISARLPRELKGRPWEEHIKIAEAYAALCPGDPAEVGSGRRPIHLVQMASEILLALRSGGLYRASQIDPQRPCVQQKIRQRAQVEQGVHDPQRHGQDYREHEHRQAHGRDEDEEPE